MPYTAPGGSAVAYDLSTTAYTGPSGAAVRISIPPLPYELPSGSGIILNLQGAYTAPPGNLIQFDADPPPTVYSAQTESYAVTDSTDGSVVVMYNVGVVESFAVTDTTSETYTLVYNTSFTESMTITDTVDGANNIFVSTTESYAITDTTDFSIDLTRVVTESFAITDVLDKGRTTDAAITESFSITDEQDFNPFPVDVSGIHFDWRVNHLGYVPPAGNAIPFDVPENGQYFYSRDNLIDHHAPSQKPNLPSGIQPAILNFSYPQMYL